MNPYQELGLPSDADDKAIRAAYRRRAKAAHPDAGGTAEEFTRANRAQLVLLDPARRARFDRDGVIDADPVDNELAETMNAVATLLDGAMVMCAQSGAKPTTRDLFATMTNTARQLIAEFAEQRRSVEKHLNLSESLVGRFHRLKDGEPNRLATLLNARITAQRFALTKLQHQEAVLNRAIEFLKDYRFEQDAPAAGIAAMKLPVAPGATAHTNFRW
jgi:curved DNA-binding protein CbpA